MTSRESNRELPGHSIRRRLQVAQFHIYKVTCINLDDVKCSTVL